ncbi:AMP-binding enzyme, partial [Streptosporangium subroseum]
METPTQGDITPRPGGIRELPLSFGQERMWFLDQLEQAGGAAAHNIFIAERLRGTLDAGALERALAEIVARHEVLRTRFPSRDGAPVQVVDEVGRGAAPLNFESLDLTDLPESEREAEVLRLVRERIERRFDLAGGPPLRTGLLRLSEREHVLYAVFHHIAVDGWSVGVFLHELASLYEAFLGGGRPPLAPPPIQYADFALWQRERVEGLAGERLGQVEGPAGERSGRVEEPTGERPGRVLGPTGERPGRLEGQAARQLDYWRRRLADPPTLELPTDRPRPPVRTTVGGCATLRLPQPLSDRIDELARRTRCTPFMVLLTVYLVLLSRYSGQKDICVGTPVAGRDRDELESLIGLFLNTLVIRGDLSGDPTFQEMLVRVRTAALKAYSNGGLPFDRLVSELNVPRDLSRTPLFQAQLVLHDYRGTTLVLPGVTAEFLDLGIRPAMFDLSLEFGRQDDGLDLFLIYNEALFDQATAERMAGHLETMLVRVVDDPGLRLSELGLLPDAERERSLHDWNDTAVPRPEATLHDLVAGEAGAVAVMCGGRSLTYAELEVEVNRLANRLRREGVRPGVLVALCASRSLEMLVGLLAVMRAGGAYLP